MTINAVDASGNATEAVYEVDQAGTGKTFTYDANGNMTSDGRRTFEWDAKNQLVAINSGTHRSEFTCDGHKRRVRIVEKDNGLIQSETLAVWCDMVICEERPVGGTPVARRAFARGEQIAGVAHFLAPDHLGSTEVVTDIMGTVVTRYVFDPWGRRSTMSGTEIAAVGYAGYRWHASSGLALTLHRGYDADLARWLSEDPPGVEGGVNLFAYVENSPVRSTDPLGLAIWICSRAAWRGTKAEGMGNHAYLWDDRNKQCCGRGSRTQCKEGGPGVDPCRRIADSDGWEGHVMAAFGLKNPGAPGGRIGERCESCC